MQDTMPQSDHTVIQWIIGAAATIGAAGLAALLKVWLENRRMERDDFRKTLVERIQDLESQIMCLHAENADLREEVGRLKADGRRRDKGGRGDHDSPESRRS